jgi:thioredoxin
MPIVACAQCGAKNRVDERAETQHAVCGRCGASLPAISSSDHPLEVTDASFANVLGQAGSTPLLIDCWAPWCGPCRALTPVIEALAKEAAGRYVVGKLNVDESPNVASRFQIQGIPTLLIFRNGKEVDRLVGAQPKRAIEERLLAHAGR